MSIVENDLAADRQLSRTIAVTVNGRAMSAASAPGKAWRISCAKTSDLRGHMSDVSTVFVAPARCSSMAFYCAHA